MRRFVSSETLTIGVLVVVFAGDFFRNLLTVPGWVALALLCAAWAIAALAVNRVSWRSLPRTLLLVLGWIALSPLWSPYPWTSAALTAGFLLTVTVGIALATTIPLDDLFRRLSVALRALLVSSLVFEFAVALSGAPLYPVGMNAPPGTSIELAWCRGLLFVDGGRIQGIVGNANLLAMLALLFLITALVRFAKGQSRWLAVTDVTLALLLLYKTSSATVSLAALAVFGVWALAWFARRPRLVTRIGFSALLVAALGVIGFSITNWPTVATALGKSPDMTNRFGIWEAVIGRIVDQPVVGHGFAGWWPTWDGWFAIHSIRDVRVQQAHNAWLDITMQIGFVGLVLFVALVASTAWLLWRHAARKSDPAAVIAVGFVTAMLVQTLTESRLLSEWGIALLVILAIVSRRASLAPPPKD